ncbi:hypothetical protein [Aquiflexum sp.]
MKKSLQRNNNNTLIDNLVATDLQKKKTPEAYMGYALYSLSR